MVSMRSSEITAATDSIPLAPRGVRNVSEGLRPRRFASRGQAGGTNVDHLCWACWPRARQLVGASPHSGLRPALRNSREHCSADRSRPMIGRSRLPNHQNAKPCRALHKNYEELRQGCRAQTKSTTNLIKVLRTLSERRDVFVSCTLSRWVPLRAFRAHCCVRFAIVRCAASFGM